MQTITFQAGLWVSQNQYNETNFEVGDMVEIYLEESTSDVSEHISADRESEKISAPLECPDTSFTAPYPCDPLSSATYDNLLFWWDDYTRCENLVLKGDSNLLITNCDSTCGGGRAFAFGKKAYANGSTIENLSSSFVNYESGCSGFEMATAFHEIGHNLMDGPADGPDGDQYGHHDTGRTVERPEGWAVSPMSAGYFNQLSGPDECGNFHHAATGDLWEFNYSPCARSFFTKK